MTRVANSRDMEFKVITRVKNKPKTREEFKVITKVRGSLKPEEFKVRNKPETTEGNKVTRVRNKSDREEFKVMNQQVSWFAHQCSFQIGPIH